MNSPIQNLCKNNSYNTTAGAVNMSSGQSSVATLFRLFLGISGGIALILIIYSGYRKSISGGNAEKNQAAKETLASAVLGQLFIIFSITILQIIDVDILGIYAK